jgi:hypothetical protein
MVPYRVTEKGQNEKTRLSKLLQFKGPDSDTTELLNDRYIPWLMDPSSFWTGSLLPEINLLKPQAHIVSRLLQAKRDDFEPCPQNGPVRGLLVHAKGPHGRLVRR